MHSHILLYASAVPVLDSLWVGTFGDNILCEQAMYVVPGSNVNAVYVDEDAALGKRR